MTWKHGGRFEVASAAKLHRLKMNPALPLNKRYVEVCNVNYLHGVFTRYSTHWPTRKPARHGVIRSARGGLWVHPTKSNSSHHHLRIACSNIKELKYQVFSVVTHIQLLIHLKWRKLMYFSKSDSATKSS